MKAKFFVIMVSVCLAGCGSFVPIQTLDKSGIEVVLAAQKLPVVSSEKARTMSEVGSVVGYSCKNKFNQPKATRVGATDQAKIAAVHLGATAIGDLVCKEGGVSLVTNCWQSWQCRAMALR